MPTYAVTTARTVTPEQRARLAASITAIHQVESNAPRYFVQVVFYTVGPGSIFIGGEPAPGDHVWVRADIRAGRTAAQKAAIMRRIMGEASEILAIPEQSVWVYISDIPAQGVLEFGSVLPEPGGEVQWLEGLPAALREKLVRSG